MKELLAVKTRTVDTLALRKGTTINAGQSFTLYQDYPGYDDDDVTTQSEDMIVRWLLASWRDLLLGELGVSPNDFVAVSVRDPVIERGQSKPGDIDLLICEENRPDLAIGIQCKRVKVRALSPEQDDYNKLPDVGGGVKQANFQRRNLGFHRNYLMIVIETYGRSRSTNNVLFRGPTNETWHEIYQFPWRENLDPDVGIIFVKVTQPTGKTFNNMSLVGVCLNKEAARLDQSSNLTNRIADFMRLRGNGN